MLLRDRTGSLASPIIITRIRQRHSGTNLTTSIRFRRGWCNPVSKVSGWRHAIVQFSVFFFWNIAQFALIIIFFEKINRAYMNVDVRNIY
jgi:hypothetical protein